MDNSTEFNVLTGPVEGGSMAESFLFSGPRNELPYRQVFLWGLDVLNPACAIVILFGLISNVLNIVVFTKMEARDTVTVSLLALSISDLAFLVLVSPHIAAKSLEHLQMRGFPINWLFDSRALVVPFFFFSIIFQETSTLITAYLAVVRCACVAMPLKVKTTFTTSRSIAAIIVLFLCCLFLRLPKYLCFRFQYIFVDAENVTVFKFTEIDDGGLSSSINDIVNKNALPWSAFTIISISVAVMATKLQASARFRMAASVTKYPTSGTIKQKTDNIHQVYIETETLKKDTHVQNTENAKQGYSLSKREAQMVRSVILVSIIFMICQIPLGVNSLIRSIDPRFDITIRPGPKYPKHLNLYAVAATLATLFAYVNASVNIVVYMNVNSRYNQQLKTLFQTFDEQILNTQL